MTHSPCGIHILRGKPRVCPVCTENFDWIATMPVPAPKRKAIVVRPKKWRFQRRRKVG